jgi:teichuronic acid biosynthesis glycosyltransferase TuaG
MQNDLVSIITPSYNSAKFIDETIKSVQAQTYQEWEMIIVDDASTDKSVEVITQLIQDDDRIKCIELQQNIGAAMARNKALEVANGKFIAFLDSDDLWLPNKLKCQLDFMQTNNYSFTFTAYTPFSEDGKEEYSSIEVPQCIDYNGYCKNTIIGCLTVIINREVTGDFRMKDIRSSHDMALWLEVMDRGFDAYGLNEVLAKYRLVKSSNTAKKYKAAKEVWDVYRKVEHISLLKSTYFFMHYAYNAIRKRF